MSYDLEKILSKAYKEESQVPTTALNRTTLQKMKECGDMKKANLGKFTKIAAVVCGTFVVSSAAIYAASEIKTHIWDAKVEMADGQEVEIAGDVECKKLPQDALIGDDVWMTLDEANEMLDITLLDLEEADSKEVRYSGYENEDGSLGRVEILRTDFLSKPYEYQVYLTYSILNEGADEGHAIVHREGNDAWGGKVLKAEVFSENLNTKVVVYEAGAYGDADGYLMASFVYDGVFYKLQSDGMRQEDLLEIIEKLN